MKNLKKLFALVLAVAMMMSMAVTVGATEATPIPSSTVAGAAHIIIHGARAGTYYELYRVLDVETVPTTGEPVYLVRPDNRVAAEGTTPGNFWDDFVTGESSKFTVSRNNKHISKTSLPAKDTDLQQFALEVWNYAKDNGISADITVPITLSGTHTSAAPRPYGYYVMRSFHVTENGERVYSPMANIFTLPAKDTSTNTYGDAIITEKNAVVHSITKEVKEDSLADPANAEIGWGDQNAAEIGQLVEFRITVDVAPGTDVYTITDSMPNFTNFTEPEVFYSGGTKLTKDTQYTYASETSGFTITLKDDFRKIVQDADFLTILYKAALKSEATIAGTGNVNTATLKHGKETVGTDSTTTYTCQFNVMKVDETQMNPLAGAVFNVTNEKGDVLHFTKMSGTTVDTYVLAASGVTDITTNDTGRFNICGLDTHDKYYLVEKEAPENYVKMDKQEIIITPDAQNPSFVKDITVVNLPGVDMPTTGGTGTTIFYIAGGLLTAAALILLVTKKRMGA